jgi:L-seryl-tRNA(Ser) seleniumtransferase
MSPNPLRNIPSVNELLDSPPLRRLVDRLSHNVVVSTVRSVLDEVRQEVQHAATDMTLPSVSELAERVARRITEVELPALQPVINATGILLHPDLGHAPLAEEATPAAAAVAQDYANLELDLSTAQHCRRTAAVESLLRQLTGAEAALVVNNHAGALMLTLAALATGREVIVSRGQLAEIDGGFRLPEGVAASGAVLREVGTVNISRTSDYLDAIGDRTAALLLVHADDWTMVGRTESATLPQLVETARRRQIPVVHHLGYGTLIDLGPWGLSGEPVVPESVQAGADMVLFSGDGLLGGPQCGIVVGRRALVERVERHPLAWALRVGKPTLAALAATLRLYQEPEKARRTVPVLQLLTTSVENLKNRAERLAPQIAAAPAIASSEARESRVSLGGVNLPGRELPTWCVALAAKQGTAERLAAALRLSSPSVVGRVEQGQVLLDLRSVPPRHDQSLVTAVNAVGVRAE